MQLDSVNSVNSFLCYLLQPSDQPGQSTDARPAASGNAPASTAAAPAEPCAGGRSGSLRIALLSGLRNSRAAPESEASGVVNNNNRQPVRSIQNRLGCASTTTNRTIFIEDFKPKPPHLRVAQTQAAPAPHAQESNVSLAPLPATTATLSQPQPQPQRRQPCTETVITAEPSQQVHAFQSSEPSAACPSQSSHNSEEATTQLEGGGSGLTHHETPPHPACTGMPWDNQQQGPGSDPCPGLLSLPCALMEDVLGRCNSIKAVAAAACTCRALRKAVASDSLWELMFAARWGDIHFPTDNATRPSHVQQGSMAGEAAGSAAAPSTALGGGPSAPTQAGPVVGASHVTTPAQAQAQPQAGPTNLIGPPASRVPSSAQYHQPPAPSSGVGVGSPAVPSAPGPSPSVQPGLSQVSVVGAAGSGGGGGCRPEALTTSALGGSRVDSSTTEAGRQWRQRYKEQVGLACGCGMP